MEFKDLDEQILYVMNKLINFLERTFPEKTAEIETARKSPNWMLLMVARQIADHHGLSEEKNIAKVKLILKEEFPEGFATILDCLDQCSIKTIESFWHYYDVICALHQPDENVPETPPNDKK